MNNWGVVSLGQRHVAYEGDKGGFFYSVNWGEIGVGLTNALSDLLDTRPPREFAESAVLLAFEEELGGMILQSDLWLNG